MLREPRSDRESLLIALSQANDCFLTFWQHTNDLAADNEYALFYRRMPRFEAADTGERFSRCQVWRRYVILQARRAGREFDEAAVEVLSDHEVVELFRVRGMRI